MNPNVLVMSRKMAENVAPMSNLAIISITDPSSPPAKINSPKEQTLRLSFHDVNEGEKGFVPMSMSDAFKVVRFIEEVWNKVDYLVVHCEGGICRSSGVAAAILKSKTGDDSQIFNNPRYVPNSHCYKMVLWAFEHIEYR